MRTQKQESIKLAMKKNKSSTGTFCDNSDDYGTDKVSTQMESDKQIDEAIVATPYSHQIVLMQASPALEKRKSKVIGAVGPE